MNTCETCARWTPPDPEYQFCEYCLNPEEREPGDECLNNPECRGLGTCGGALHARHCHDDGAGPLLSQVEVSDASVYGATLRTAPTFGCLLYEPQKG